MLTHRNIMCNILQLNIIFSEEEMSWNGGHNGEGDVILAVLPLFHSYGELHTVLCWVGLIIPRRVKHSKLSSRLATHRPEKQGNAAFERTFANFL